MTTMEVKSNSRGLLSTQTNKKRVLIANILVIILLSLESLTWANLFYDEIFTEYALIFIFSSITVSSLIIGIPLISFYFSSDLLSKIFLLLPSIFYIWWILQDLASINYIISGLAKANGEDNSVLLILCLIFVEVSALIINIKYILTYSESREDEDVVNLDAIIDKETSFMLYAISILIPVAGIIIGAIYVTKNEKELKSIGKDCLVCSLFSMIICIPIIFFFWI